MKMDEETRMHVAIAFAKVTDYMNDEGRIDLSSCSPEQLMAVKSFEGGKLHLRDRMASLIYLAGGSC